MFAVHCGKEEDGAAGREMVSVDVSGKQQKTQQLLTRVCNFFFVLHLINYYLALELCSV